MHADAYAGTTRRASVPIAAMLAFPMPVQFTATDVRAIAGLAQLELDATQVELFVRQLGDFLAYAHDVLAVNTEGVAPTASMVTRHEADRPDQVQPCLERAAALSNAPDPQWKPDSSKCRESLDERIRDSS